MRRVHGRLGASVAQPEAMRSLWSPGDHPAKDQATKAHRMGRAAALDRCHHLQLVAAHVTGIGLAPCRSVIAEDIRNLQCRTGHWSG